MTGSLGDSVSWVYYNASIISSKILRSFAKIKSGPKMSPLSKVCEASTHVPITETQIRRIRRIIRWKAERSRLIWDWLLTLCASWRRGR